MHSKILKFLFLLVNYELLSINNNNLFKPYLCVHVIFQKFRVFNFGYYHTHTYKHLNLVHLYHSYHIHCFI